VQQYRVKLDFFFFLTFKIALQYVRAVRIFRMSFSDQITDFSRYLYLLFRCQDIPRKLRIISSDHCIDIFPCYQFYLV